MYSFIFRPPYAFAFLYASALSAYLQSLSISEMSAASPLSTVTDYTDKTTVSVYIESFTYVLNGET